MQCALSFVVIDYRKEAQNGPAEGYAAFKKACVADYAQILDVLPETDNVIGLIADLKASARVYCETQAEGVQTDKLVCIVGMDTPVHGNMPLELRQANAENTQPAERLLHHLYQEGVPFFVVTPDVYELNQKLLLLPSWIKQKQDQGRDFKGLADLVRAKGTGGFRDMCVKALERMHREGGGLMQSDAVRPDRATVPHALPSKNL